MKNILKTSKGFTLVEMLIVIAIIAILAGIIFVGLPGFRNNALDTRRIADMKNVQNGLALYYSKCRAYPSDAAVDASGCTTAKPAAAGTLVWGTLETKLSNANVGVKNIPYDPLQTSGSTYYYGFSSDGQSYVLGAQLTAERDVLRESSAIDVTTFGVACKKSSFLYCTGSQ